MEKMKKNSKIIDFGLLYFDFVIYSLVSVLAKFASNQDNLVMAGAFMTGEFVLLGIYAILWQQVLKRFSLVMAMSSKGITVIFGLIWSALLFNEVVTLCNVLGVCIIMTGIWVVSSDG